MRERYGGIVDEASYWSYRDKVIRVIQFVNFSRELDTSRARRQAKRSVLNAAGELVKSPEYTAKGGRDETLALAEEMWPGGRVMLSRAIRRYERVEEKRKKAIQGVISGS